MQENWEKIKYDCFLCSIPEIMTGKRRRLLDYFGTPEHIFKAGKKELEQVPYLTEKDVVRILSCQTEDYLELLRKTLTRQNISFVTEKEKAFPERLKRISDPPYGLFYKGSLPKDSQPAVAVVGARKVTEAGKQIADKFGYELAANGVQVISGMALGVDICAQRGALKYERGRTFAILGTGVDICYPRQHIESYMSMQQRGGVISEFPLGTPAFPGNFPVRNRIISGLSDGVLVIEAKKKSGSLITAETGLEQGREIFVVPGGMCDPQYEGGNELLKQGAVLVTRVEDILDGLGLFFDEDVVTKKKKTNFMLETTEKIVYSILSLEPIHISELMNETGLSMPVLMEQLLSLQGKRLIKSIGNNYYVIRL